MFIYDLKKKYLLNISKSFIVQAPAGSGKTTLLILRILSILSNYNGSLDKILAVTFTNKAADEMRNRMQNYLIKSQAQVIPKNTQQQDIYFLCRKVLKNDIKQNWNILNNLNKLKIQTIDSFCMHIIKQSPFISNLGINIKISKNPSYLYQTAIDDFFNAHYREKDYHLSNILHYMDYKYDILKSLFIDILLNREKWLVNILNKNEKDLKHILHSGVKKLISINLKKIKQYLPKNFKRFCNILIYTFSLIRKKSFYINDIGKTKNFWLFFIEFIFIKNDYKLKDLFLIIKNCKKYTAFIKIIRRDYKQNNFKFFLQAKNIYFLNRISFKKSEWKITKSFLFLLPFLFAHLKIIFKKNFTVDFNEITLSTINVLKKNNFYSDILFKLDNKIQHILIDEFQDTSIMQWKILEILTESWNENDKKTLFLVGDPMQSIYNWRGAKVSLFIKTKNYGLSNIKMNIVNINCNFRSNPTITNWVNSIFFNILKKEKIATKFDQKVDKKSRSTDNFINYKIYVNSTNNHNEEIINIINKIKLKEKKSSIAILIRSRNHIGNLLDILKVNYLFYNGLEIESLFDKQHIQDLLSLTKSILSLTNDISWLSLLRSSFIRIKLSDIEKIYKYKKHKLIWYKLKNIGQIKNISMNAFHKIIKILPIVNLAIKKSHRFSISNIILDTWLKLNANISYFKKNEMKDINNFFKILIKCENDNFFINEALLDKRIKSEFISHSSTFNEINIMTIYKSKGLEFDNVIIPYLNRGVKKNSFPLVNFLELIDNRDYYFLFAIKNKKYINFNLYQYINSENSKSNFYEIIRLLYVALTRSKKRLYLIGSLEIKNNKLSISKNSFLYLLANNIKNYMQKEQYLFHIKSIDKKSENLKKYISFRNVKYLISNNHIYEKIHYYISNDVIKKYVRMNHDWKKVIGKFIHYIFEKYLSNKPFHLNMVIKIYLKKKLSLIGASDRELYFSVKYLKIVLLKFNKSRFVYWILKKRIEEKNEYFIIIIIKNKLYRFIIDRMFLERNILFIVDYKCCFFSKKSFKLKFENICRSNDIQLNNYKLVLKNRYNGKNEIRKLLYFPIQDILYEL